MTFEKLFSRIANCDRVHTWSVSFPPFTAHTGHCPLCSWRQRWPRSCWPSATCLSTWGAGGQAVRSFGAEWTRSSCTSATRFWVRSFRSTGKSDEWTRTSCCCWRMAGTRCFGSVWLPYCSVARFLLRFEGGHSNYNWMNEWMKDRAGVAFCCIVKSRFSADVGKPVKVKYVIDRSAISSCNLKSNCHQFVSFTLTVFLECELSCMSMLSTSEYTNYQTHLNMIWSTNVRTNNTLMINRRICVYGIFERIKSAFSNHPHFINNWYLGNQIDWLFSLIAASSM